MRHGEGVRMIPKNDSDKSVSYRNRAIGIVGRKPVAYQEGGKGMKKGSARA